MGFFSPKISILRKGVCQDLQILQVCWHFFFQTSHLPVSFPCASQTTLLLLSFWAELAFNLLLLSLAKALGQLLSRGNGMLFPHGTAQRGFLGAL